jgi:SAM-dependent methyltransferase
MASEFAHAIRQIELELALPLLPKRAKLLELGAGDGWQARQLQDLGFDVSAVDIQAPSQGATQYFPVTVYDGVNLPFSDQSFDAVYSSNVLEHVAQFDQVQRELARILRPDGIAIHCVPSAVWRFWTTLGHPVYALQIAWRMLSTRKNAPHASPSLDKQRTALRQLSPLARLRTALVSPRHGEHGSLVTEHWLFSHRGWEKRIKASGWHVTSSVPCKIFYTGNELFGLRLNGTTRRHLAAIFGSSTFIFVLRPPHSTGPKQ